MPPKRPSNRADADFTVPAKKKAAPKSATSKVQKKSQKTSKPAARPKKPKKVLKVSSKTLNYTLCIPTSILDNCSNLEQLTHALYQIAKAATLFNVGEIVVLDLGAGATTAASQSAASELEPRKRKIKFEEASEETEASNKKSASRLSGAMLIATLLQYFVTPPYLVSSVFKKKYSSYFKCAAKLPRLSALPFMRHLQTDQGRYREGLSVNMAKSATAKKPSTRTKYINIGKDAVLELRGQQVPVNVRVTVDTVDKKVVSPAEAYGDYSGANAAYGYSVRVARTFADIFLGAGFSGGYTQSLWVNSADFFFDPAAQSSARLDSKIPHVQKIITPSLEELQEQPSLQPANLLLVFGKWKHLCDKFQQTKDLFDGASGAHDLFDGRLDLPGVPEGYICIEDSCMVALATLATYSVPTWSEPPVNSSL
ncbi:AaceriAGL342Cp [[Ashbya] aceris (nom. inval.)]|nr:AaceriAGL342Cp [[Ashbya] aceris (nom. inval.)]